MTSGSIDESIFIGAYELDAIGVHNAQKHADAIHQTFRKDPGTDTPAAHPLPHVPRPWLQLQREPVYERQWYVLESNREPSPCFSVLTDATTALHLEVLERFAVHWTPSRTISTRSMSMTSLRSAWRTQGSLCAAATGTGKRPWLSRVRMSCLISAWVPHGWPVPSRCGRTRTSRCAKASRGSTGTRYARTLPLRLQR